MPIYRVGLSAKFDGQQEEGSTDVLEPGDRIEVKMGVSENRKVFGEFVDSAGNHWMRNDKGKLTQWSRNNWLQGQIILLKLWWLKHRPARTEKQTK